MLGPARLLSTSYIGSIDFDASLVLSILSCLIASFFLLYLWRKSSRVERKADVFPFLKLPPELRESVYEYLIDEEPCYPNAPAQESNHSLPTIVTSLFNFTKRFLQRLLPLTIWKWIYVRSRGSTPNTTSFSPLGTLDAILSSILVGIRRRFHKSNATSIIFVNRQLHSEFVSVLCKKSSFTLFIKDVNQTSRPLWNISPAIAEGMRSCEVKIMATPGMIGSFDPRVAPADWPLRDRAYAELRTLKGLERMSLRVHARGSQIWNPIWLWHYTSQAFKVCDVKGFREITFHLEGWSPGENKMCRNAEGEWEWRCSKGHLVRKDTMGSMAIRAFCGALYDDCSDCPSRQ